MKLTIELVPSSSWFTNLRSVLPKYKWDILRKDCYAKANYKCEICCGVGNNHPVECHEEWEYDRETRTQKLVRLIALCPKCHKVKHIGLAQLNGQGEACLRHLCKVNGITLEEGRDLIDEAFIVFEERSQIEWNLDISYLDKLKKKRGFK